MPTNNSSTPIHFFWFPRYSLIPANTNFRHRELPNKALKNINQITWLLSLKSLSAFYCCQNKGQLLIMADEGPCPNLPSIIWPPSIPRTCCACFPYRAACCFLYQDTFQALVFMWLPIFVWGISAQLLPLKGRAFPAGTVPNGHLSFSDY